MRFLYSILTYKIWFLLHILQRFDPKIKLFVEGRKGVLESLKEKIQKNDRVAWFHAASLGEFEQGLPVIREFKKTFGEYTILLTFFSPSGYEVKKNTDVSDIVAYLPFDTPTFAKRFLKIVRPQKAFFIKYEFWPNYLYYLRKQQIETFLLSAIFRPNQFFFSRYGGFSRSWLKTFTHIFVQDDVSKKLLGNIGYTDVTVSGDTRFDRVRQIMTSPLSQLDFVEKFKANALCVVLGSSYPEDEKLFWKHINNATDNIKYILVPHNIDGDHVKSLEKCISKKTSRFSTQNGNDITHCQVLIIDAVGYLSGIYRYADVVYIGGGQKKGGLHNILEAAVFGVPILIGPHFSKFKEACDLVALKGIFVVNSEEQTFNALNSLLSDEKKRKKQGEICSNYVNANTGATRKIMDFFISQGQPFL